jgi:DNA-binding NtrC family response regulator
MKPKVLVVDDDRTCLTVFAELLAHFNFAVTTAASADEAIALITQESFQLVITDYHMPRRTGEDVVLSVQKTQPDTPVIVTTGSAGDLPEWMQKETPTLRILPKPFSFLELPASVLALMGTKPALSAA